MCWTPCRKRWSAARLSVIPFGFGIGCLALPAQALDTVAPPIVAWDAPSECPTAQLVLLRLSDLAGGALGSLEKGHEVRGRIQRSGSDGDWELSLEISEANAPSPLKTPSPRILTAPDCDDLADAAAVAIAIALGDGAHGSAESAAASAGSGDALGASGGRGAVPGVEDGAVDAAEVELDGPSGVALALSAEAIMDSGALGSAGFGGSLQAQVRRERLGLGVYGLWLPPDATSVGADQYVEFSLLAGGLRGCYRALDGALGVDLCGGFELGWLSAASTGVVGASSRRDTWLGPTWGTLLGLRLLDGLRLNGRLEALLPLAEEEYVLNTDELVHRIPRATLRVGLGLEGGFVLF